MMKNLPQEPDYDEFDEFLIANSPYLARIKLYISQLMVGVPKMVENSSNYEVYNFSAISNDQNTVVIGADEFWNINFETLGGLYIFHKKNAQTYYFKEENGKFGTITILI